MNIESEPGEGVNGKSYVLGLVVFCFPHWAVSLGGQEPVLFVLSPGSYECTSSDRLAWGLPILPQ